MKSTKQLIDAHYKACEKFATAQTGPFQKRAEWLGHKLKKFFPELEGFLLGNRVLIPTPCNVTLPRSDNEGNRSTVPFDDIGIYMPSGVCGRHRLDVTPECLNLLCELNELINYNDSPSPHTLDCVDVRFS